jgi:hypothetical protein
VRPTFVNRHALDRLLLEHFGDKVDRGLALAESALARQQTGPTKSRKAS